MSDQEQISPEIFDKAAEALFGEVYLPAFIKRCNELGIEFQDEGDLQAALENVATIKATESQVGSTSSLHKQANLALKSLIGTDAGTDANDFERFLSELVDQ